MKKILFILLVVIASLTKLSHAQIISTVAGNGIGGCCIGDGGPATSAELNNPEGGVIFDSAGNIYWADGWDGRVRKLNMAGIITTITGAGSVQPGDGGLAINSSMYHLSGVAFDPIGNMYICDNYDATIRKINTANIITTIAGIYYSPGYNGDGGQASSAQIQYPTGVACDSIGNVYFTSSNSVRKVTVSTGIITTIAGDSMPGYSGDGGLATTARLHHPQGVTIDATGNLFITDSWNNVIRKVNTAGIITTIAGNGFGAGTGSGGFSGDGGTAIAAELNVPIGGVAFDASGNMYIADNENNRIRIVNISGIINTFAGNGFGAPSSGGFGGDGGLATTAELYNPMGVAFDTSGNLYISDASNYRIRMVSSDPTGITKISKTKISIYPNPTATQISLNAESISNYQNSTITIQNTLGQTVKKLSFTKNIPVSDLAEGCYFLQITLSSGEIYKTKFIKQ